MIRDIDPQVRIAVLMPGPTELSVLLDDRMRDSGLAETDTRADPAKASADHEYVIVLERLRIRRRVPFKMPRIDLGKRGFFD